MVTCVPHLPTLRGTPELSSDVHVIPDLIQILFTLRLSPFRRFHSESSSSGNRSHMIPADSHPTLLSSTFVTRNATQRGQLWTVADFRACNPKQTSTTDRGHYKKSTCANHIVTMITLVLVFLHINNSVKYK